MAVKIIDVKITHNYGWEDINRLPSWNTFRNSSTSWQQVTQTIVVNEPLKIEVEVVENDWKGFERVYDSWQKIIDTFGNWLNIKNW